MTHEVTGHRYAVKCFTRHVPDQQARYRAISEKLTALSSSKLSQPWKIGFEYLPDAVLVGTSRYPVLKMEWAQGVTLSAWLDAHHRDSHGIDRLAERFSELISDLALHGIAHGDLQHGNLLVADDGTLRLLDYDGMFVPALADLGGTERGHRNYQSPSRGDHDFDAEMDRFSAWVIYFALKAIAVDPVLWGQLHEPQGEYLLLTDEDFKHPSISPRFPALLSHSDGQIRKLAEQVCWLASQPLADLPALATTSVAAAVAPVVAHTGATGNGGLPSWMNGHLVPPTPPPSGGATTPLDMMPRFAGRRGIDILAAILLMVTLVIPVVCVALSIPVTITLALMAGAAVAVWAGQRSRAETITLRQQLRDLGIRRREAADAVNAGAALRRKREKFDLSEQQRLAQLPGLRDQLKHQYDKDLAEVERNRIAVSADLDRRISALAQKLQDALSAALAKERNDFIQRELGRFTVASASISGIGKALTRELANHGIRTAADFTGTRLSQGSGYGYNSVTVMIVRANGQAVHVRGIGEAKASALMAWRDDLASKARLRCTIHSPTLGPAITDRFASDRKQLRSERQSLDIDAQSRRDLAKQRLEVGLRRLSDDAAKAAEAAAKQREDFARRLVQVQTAQTELALIKTSIADTRRHQRMLSHTRYCRFALIGR
ncbi:AarF/UbiB family protein [Nocardia sp. NPDC049737]|uniref:AarF/UbiB family protein n=1 Tax=Nocardia sp. NPDC049737 TaxID=3154358 RepID=UPI003438555D